jgi:chemotaxis family two-component system sensor kinase Cph1
MQQVLDFFRQLMESGHFMPRWVCGKWTPFHGWLYIISDLVIFLAYMAIPIIMVYFVKKRWQELPFRGVFWLFIGFIALCGTSHLMDAIIFYVPHYRLNALVLVATAAVSVVTVGGMVKVLPEALTYKSPKELQTVVDEQTAELSSKVKQLSAMHNRISRKKEQVERFAYITSHNLRSPAANLHGLIELLAESGGEKAEEVRRRALKSSRQLLSTLDDVSKVLADSSPLVDSSINRFDEMLRVVEQDLQIEMERSGLRLICDFEACPEILYPKDHLRSILYNLVSNSIKYRHPDRPSEVRLTTWTEGRSHFLTCSDNGLGIDLERHGEALFHLYKTFHDHPDAKGVGLFLVRHQLESLDGEITIESTPGVGTTFTVRFGNPRSTIV